MKTLRALTLLLALALPAWADAPNIEVREFIVGGSLQAGEPTTVRVLVLNRGAAPVENVGCTIHTEGRTWGELRTTRHLGPGEETWLQGKVTPPVEGNQTVVARVWFDSLAEDPEPNDNQRALEVQVARTVRPDFAIVGLKAPEQVHVGERVQVLVEVANIGRAEAGGSAVHLVANGEEVARARIEQRLYPEARADFVLDWTPREGGAINLVAQVDQLGAIQELDEENNSQTVAVQVASARLPDLKVSAVAFEGEVRAGVSCSTFVDVANEGESAAYQIPVHLVIDGNVVARKTARGIFMPGQVEKVLVSWIPVQPGAQSLAVLVDPEDKVVEAAEHNNRHEVALEILGQPAANLKVVRVEAPGDPMPGTETWAGVVVHNAGEIPALSCRVILSVDGMHVAQAQDVVPIQPGDERWITLRWLPLRPGPTTLAAEVQARGGNERDLSDNSGELVVQVGTPSEPTP